MSVGVEQLGQAQAYHAHTNAIAKRSGKFIRQTVCPNIALHSVVKLVPLREKPWLVAPRQGAVVVLAVVIERVVDERRTVNKAEVLQIKESVLRADKLCIDKFKPVFFDNIGSVKLAPSRGE